jgi:hypothetical protein
MQRHTLKDSSETTKSTNKAAAAPPASTTLKVQTKQPRLIAAMNFASTKSELHRQQLNKKSKPPTSVTAQKHKRMQWPHKSRPCLTRLHNSPKRWPTKRMHQTAAAAEAAAAAAAAEEGTKEEPDTLQCNTSSHAAWAATVHRMVSIQSARTTRAPPARGNYPTTTRRRLGMTEKAVASTGHHPYTSASSSRTMHYTQAKQHQPTDRDQDSPIGNKKKMIAKQ